MNPNALPIGTTLSNGKYEIKAIKGQGGFGITYIATFVSLKTTVAIKECFLSRLCKRHGTSVTVISDTYETLYQKYRTEFLHEAQKIAGVTHPNIVRIQDYFTENNTAYYVMEYIDSVTLQDLIKSRGPLSEIDSVLYIKQISEALQVVHKKNIIHRDIKPGNILIKDNSTAFLIDFGAARDIVNETEHTVILTEGFAPPEQYQKDGAKGFFVDVYGLGATMYYCLTGLTPLSPELRLNNGLQSPREINTMISPSINDIVIKALELDPKKRHDNISTFLYELTTAVASSPIQQISLTTSQREALNNFHEFLNDESAQSYILSGAIHTGKTHLIHSFLSEALKRNRHCRVLTVGSRLAEAIRNKSQIESVSSIYSLIYDFSEKAGNNTNDTASTNIQTDESPEKQSFNLKANEDTEDEIYIVDEAHLLSDLYMDNELLIFGSGKLLQDFIAFVDFKNHPKRKLVLIGDKSQLFRGSEQESALSEQHLKDTYSLISKVFNLIQTIPFGKNSIITNAIQIHEQIQKGKYNQLKIDEDGISIKSLDISEFKESYRTLNDPNETICISYSNRQVLATNLSIRETIGLKQIIAVGDRVITHNRFFTYQNNSEHSVYSGEFGKVLSVNPVPITVSHKTKNTETSLTLWEVEINFPRIAVTARTHILESFLISETSKLSKGEKRALYAWSYREKLAEQKSKLLTSAPYREAYLTIALVKYAYAITCHKAQGYSWKKAFIDFESDQGKNNKAYFSWCYTALTRAESFAFLINPPSISPFYKCTWTENPNAFDSGFKLPPHLAQIEITPEQEIEALKYNFPSDKPDLKKFWLNAITKLKAHNIRIDQIVHNPYQELYHFSDSIGQKGKIVFHYNNRFEFTKRIAQPNTTFTQEIIAILDKEDPNSYTYESPRPLVFSFDFLEHFYIEFQEKLKTINAVIFDHHSSKYQEKYTMYKDGQFAECAFYYGEDGCFSSVYPTRASSLTFLAEIHAIVFSNFISQ